MQKFKKIQKLHLMGDSPQIVNFFGKKSARKIPHQEKPRRNALKKSDAYGQDILEINGQILDLLEAEFNLLPSLKEDVDRLKWIEMHGDSENEKQLASAEVEKLENKIKLIDSGYREAKYIHRTEKILAEYAALMSEPIKVDFMGNKISDQQDKKNIIIMQFLNVAKDYMPVKPLECQKRNMNCEECNVELQREDDFLYVCPLCGYTVKHLTCTSSYQENNRINATQRYVYDKRAHFGDSIKKFQAKQNTTISKEVYNDLWSKLKSHDISVDKLTKDHLYEFLKSTDHSDHYEDITLIYCEMTGNPAPNISHLENSLFRLFDEVDPVYERVKSVGRVNFLNGQFVLFKLLQKLKFPCKEEDFYILKTREKMLEHDQIWQKICQELSWTYIATV